MKSGNAPNKVHFGFVRHAARQNLRQLVLLRCISLVGQSAAVGVVHFGPGLELPLRSLLMVVGALALFNLLSAVRLALPWRVTNAELLFQILVDIAQLTAMLHWTGGETNPFSGFLLLPLALTTIVLPMAYTYLVAAVVIGAYTLLVFSSVHVNLVGFEGDPVRLLEYGSWANYLCLVALLTYFLRRMLKVLLDQERQLGEEREKGHSNECVVRIGAVVAGAAHELGSPLTALSVQLHQLRKHRVGEQELREGLDAMAQQVAACRAALAGMMDYGRRSLAESEDAARADEFCRDLLARWRSMRPQVRLSVQESGPQPAPRIRADIALGHALLNLLNNAADVSPDYVALSLSWTGDTLCFVVADRGPGFSPADAEFLGKPFRSSKGGQGRGIGLLLVRTTVERLGGTVVFANDDGGGARVEITLPMHALEPLDGAAAGAPESVETRHSAARPELTRLRTAAYNG